MQKRVSSVNKIRVVKVVKGVIYLPGSQDLSLEMLKDEQKVTVKSNSNSEMN